MPRYYSLMTSGTEANLDIYGEITSMPWDESDVSASSLSKQLDALGAVDTINVRINSYGGEVAEGLAIYNALRRHNAHVVTYCDGMACSIASVIFMAGDQRVMSESSLLMIHNAWSWATGNAAELRKQADDLDTINQASKTAYLSRVCIDDEELSRMMDAETFISADDALVMGFATRVEDYESERPSQSAKSLVMQRIMQHQADAMQIDAKQIADAVCGLIAARMADDPEDEPETETDQDPDNTEQPPDEVDETDEDDKPSASAKQALFSFLTKEM